MTPETFKFLYPIGRGGFGVVWRATHIHNNTDYAIKEMCKAKVIIKKSVSSVFNEFRYLASLNSRFIANMHFAFQDKYKLYLVMDLKQERDLRFHLGHNRVFNETTTRFLIACIIQALEYLHSQQIIHRDVKPENLLIDAEGYVCLTDLGIARKFNQNNCKETSGTPGYMAPEVMFGQNHGYCVDFYAVGIIAYECMYGQRPYNGKFRQQIRQQIADNPAKVDFEKLPLGWSIEAGDFINRLIQRKPSNRLGFRGIKEIKDHPWFNRIQWDKLSERTLVSPFVPSKRVNSPVIAQDDNWDMANSFNIDRIKKLLNKPTTQELFQGYFYFQE